MYYKQFWFVKYIDLEPIIFTINFNTVSFSKVFNTFDYVFLLIILLTTFDLLNKFITFQKKNSILKFDWISLSKIYLIKA